MACAASSIDLQAVTLGDGHERIHVGRLSVEVHRHQTLDPAAGGVVDEPAATYGALPIDEILNSLGDKLNVAGSISQKTGARPSERSFPRLRRR